MIRRLVIAALAALALGAPRALAQPETPVTSSPLPNATGPTPGCVRARPAAPAGGALPETPVTWNDFAVEGRLRDSSDTVRALFAPVMTRRTSLTDASRADIVNTGLKFGYHVLKIDPRETAKGTQAVLVLAPVQIVRKVDVKVDVKITQSLFTTLLDDQVRRRMALRVGTPMPYDADERACLLDEERARIADYLHFEEGYFDAQIEHQEVLRDDGIELKVRITLGEEYTTGQVKIANQLALATTIDPRVIVRQFHHDSVILSSRFTRQSHLEDIQKVVKLLQKRGFPAVRVHTSFEQDPAGSFNRATHKVDFQVYIDPRRRIDLVFEGNDPDSVTEEQLREQLTFGAASSSDDVEATNSAHAIVAYLQSRGWFDAHVTWSRERFQNPRDPAASFDRITFQIEQGNRRAVRAIAFAGNKAFTADQLEDVIGTTQEKLSTSLFGGNTNATSAQLAADVDRLTQEYRRAGYRDARVHVEAATDPSAFASAALTAALAAADRGDGLYVRYVVDEGEPTLLAGIEVSINEHGTAGTDRDNGRVCGLALNQLGELFGVKQLARARAPGGRCAAPLPTSVKFREDDAGLTRDQLKSYLFTRGRPRADVGYEVAVIAPHRVVARYTLTNVQPLQIGKVVVRGNFRTRSSIILGELGLKEGAPFTQDALADGARRLRNTALFDAVSVTMPDLDTTNDGEVNAVVEVVERYDFFAQVNAEAGYSSYNGAFLKLIPSLKNLFGVGISFDIAGTIGLDLAEYLRNNDLRLRQLSAESTLRIPQWLSRRISPVEFQTELTAYHRRQDTPQFGPVTTDGVTLTLSRTWERKRIGSRPARAITTGVHYDFRLRERPIDVLRPIGADDDQTQVPISTRTGSVGTTFEWEQRVDRQGTLSPLSPEAGFRLEGTASLASQIFGGQDTFLKLSAAGTKYWPIGSSLVLRGDLRYDQGIPLGSAVLLPEVERFFAGGDATVRGYDDERLATEIVQVGVPPFSRGSLNQIRILP
ncbi:MAG TPA: POTRA domain-containing protein, partial [Kofleriaceae bacterium]